MSRLDTLNYASTRPERAIHDSLAREIDKAISQALCNEVQYWLAHSIPAMPSDFVFMTRSAHPQASCDAIGKAAELAALWGNNWAWEQR